MSNTTFLCLVLAFFFMSIDSSRSHSTPSILQTLAFMSLFCFWRRSLPSPEHLAFHESTDWDFLFLRIRLFSDNCIIGFYGLSCNFIIFAILVCDLRKKGILGSFVMCDFLETLMAFFSKVTQPSFYKSRFDIYTRTAALLIQVYCLRSFNDEACNTALFHPSWHIIHHYVKCVRHLCISLFKLLFLHLHLIFLASFHDQRHRLELSVWRRGRRENLQHPNPLQSHDQQGCGHADDPELLMPGSLTWTHAKTMCRTWDTDASRHGCPRSSLMCWKRQIAGDGSLGRGWRDETLLRA